jgi:two-component system OmpR family sensor kinase
MFTTHSFHDPAFLLDTMHQLLSLEGLTVKPTLIEVANLLASAFQADKTDVFVFQADAQQLVALGTSDTPMGHLQHRLDLDVLPLANGGRVAEVFRTGRPYSDGHVELDPLEREAVKTRLRVRSTLMAPFSVADEPRGVVLICSRHPEFYTPSDLTFLVTVARWVGDTTHRAELVEHLEAETRRNARRAEAEELLTVLAHDFKNLLSPLSMYFVLLRHSARQEGRDQDQALLRHVESNIQYLTSLTENLLNVSRIDRGLFALDLSWMDMATLVRETVERLSTLGTQVELHLLATPQVMGDRIRFQMAITNLLINSIVHAASKQPIQVTLRLKQEASKTWAVVEIADSGGGIEAGLLPPLFERFAAGHKSSGLGIGLYLAWHIARAHEGTTFYLSLPVEPS